MPLAAPDKRPLFNFLSVRAPEPVKVATRLRSYIEDDVLIAPEHVQLTHSDPDKSSLEHRSTIAALVYQRVFCNDPLPPADALSSLLEALLELLPPLHPACDNGDVAASSALQLSDLTQHVFEHDGSWYLLPDRLDQFAGLRQPLLNELRAVGALVDAELGEFDRTRLVKALEQVFDDRTLDRVVFSEGGWSEDFIAARRGLFDALYLLYMLRRWTAVNLEAVIEALRLLHVLEALAIDVVCERVKASGIGQDQTLISSLARAYPALAGHARHANVAGFPLIADASDLAAYLDATPVVHPIFARLFWYQKPFNDIQPVGVGDLKVVKHWLRGYTIGEISHIDNVLKGETKTRVHRQLEKSEDVFTFSSEQTQETTRDTQTTDRFELTREAEQVVKSDLAATAGANANVTYKGGPYTIVAGVNASFAYSRSQTDQSKLAQSFAHEVVDRASQRVLSRITQQRTSTKLFETEETNTHTFDNKGGADHISGFYRWLDKAYRAQVYNYGKRMMFEFTVPEPAAFLVESRLGAFDAQLDVPQPPTPPQDATLPDWLVQLSPDITLDKFRELSKTHDLTAFTYPATTKAAEFIDAATGKNLFTEHGMDSSTWQARTYSCRIVGKDYRITKLIAEGYVYFWGREGLPTDTSPAEPHDINTLEISIDGYRYVQVIDNTMERWYLGSNVASEYPSPASVPLLADDTVSLTFGFWDIAQFDVSVRADLELAPGVLEAWRNRVYAALRAVEQKKVDDENANRHQTYQTRLATYHNRLDQLKAMAVNDLLQGQSEAQNRETILAELKRQCLAMLAREFDADASDDLITDWEAMGSRSVSFSYHHLKVDEQPNADNPTQTSVGFDVEHRDVDYPLPDVAHARDKGRYVQFLEQAFEWQQLAYICYPYFWATPPRWIELMNRSDRTDPFYSAFLQAGYARIMVAVTPPYGDAVLHFLATREPWQGGASPVIGDPLYLPIYEELRRQQDDLANATPDGDPWDFTLPTALVYLENKATPLPPLSNGA